MIERYTGSVYYIAFYSAILIGWVVSRGVHTNQASREVISIIRQ